MESHFVVSVAFSLLIIQCQLTGAGSAVESKESLEVIQVKVGVIVGGEDRMGLRSIRVALSDFYEAHPHFKTRIQLHVQLSHDDVVQAAGAALDLVNKEQVMAIMGPESSPEAQFVINIGENAQVPIISYSATSPFLSPSQNPYFIRITQDDSFQVQPISALIQAFGWREIVPIYIDNEFGGGMIPALTDSLQQIGTRVPYRSVIPSSASNDRIEAELNKLKSMQTRVFIVHMTSSLGSELFTKASQLGMMSEDYVWIVTNSMGDVFNKLEPQVVQSMQGVLGIKTYVNNTMELENFTLRWKMNNIQQKKAQNLNVYGLWAYDAATSLAEAVEQVSNNITDNTFISKKSNNLANSSSTTDFSAIGVSSVGPSLLRTILSTKFRGLSGDFTLVNGQLPSSTFELINVVGSGEKTIGFWTPSYGLVRKLTSSTMRVKYSTSKKHLGTIIWPGDHFNVPKGWVASPNEKKLRIGVPVKDGFTEFVKVTRNKATNTTTVTGYCIDIFDAVMKKLPYSVPYEYVPFANQDGEPAGDYNDLIYQVFSQNFDAVIGDTTIRANRSKYVDFTLPYTESGVVMIVPVKNDNSRRAWLFIKPLTWELWVTAFCSFIFIAFVIWILEHRINEDFRGPPWHQVGTSLYYAFSTLVFSHSFSVQSNLTRFVVIIWLFVVLILTQSYTANLASLLTVEQLQPSITSVKELIKRGENAGHQEGSFVRELLIQMNFNPLKLKSYNSLDELHELLSKGTSKGGIAAAFDEIPYAKLLQASYWSKFTIVPPTYRTDGFGFGFPIGSPLVSDVSRNVLNVIEGDEMTDIENKWFRQQNGCPDPSTSFSSSSLGLDSFWGLFTIAATVALFALIVSLAGFLRDHKQVWSDKTVPIWTRTRTLCKIYDQRDLSSHTFRKNGQRDQVNYDDTSNHTTPYQQSP